MIKIENVKSPFMCYCAKVIPLAFDESMSYYECLCNFYNYLKNEIMPAINENAEATKEIQDVVIAMKEYMDNYFENLDVQEEINNKLDNMAESGELADIIAQYIDLQYVKVFDTVSAMKLGENLVNGDTVLTNGFYSVNDGGGTKYKIRQVTSDDVIDEHFLIALYDNTLVAEIIYENNTINVLQVGAITDGETDNSSLFQDIIDKCIEKGFTMFIPSGEYFVNEQLVITDQIKIQGQSLSSLWVGSDNSTKIITSLVNKSLFLINKNGTDFDFTTGNMNLIEGVEINDLKIVSTNYSQCALFISTYLSKFSNITIEGFLNGVTASYSYETEFNNIKCYNTQQGFIAYHTNTTLYLYNCWFEYQDSLSDLKSITDANYLTNFSVIPTFVLTGIVVCGTSRINLYNVACEYYCYGIYNKDSQVIGNGIDLEVMYNYAIYTTRTDQPTKTDLINVSKWNHVGYNAKVIYSGTGTFNNIEYIGDFKEQGFGGGYDIQTNSVCRVFSATQGERIIDVQPITNGYNMISGTKVNRSHFTKTGFKIDFQILKATAWANAQCNLRLPITLTLDQRIFIRGLDMTDRSDYLISLGSNGELLNANGSWITGLSNHQFIIQYEYDLVVS